MDAMVERDNQSISPIASLDVKHGALASNRSIRLQNAGLDEKGDEVIAHGWLGVESLTALRVDDYQREVLGVTSGKGKRVGLVKAVGAGVRLPDIMVGMRGQKFESPNKNDIDLLDRCYIIDGLQRVAALLQYAEANPDEAKYLRIGAEVRFNTSKESEKELFQVLNTSRIPVSPNIILRNLRDKHKALLTLYGLSQTDTKFALYKRVAWQQRMAREELISAQIFVRAASAVHGESISFSRSLPATLDRIAESIGLAAFRKNVVHFFDVLDECFGVRNVAYKEVSPQLRGNFLTTLGAILSSHVNFWRADDPDVLFVDAPTRRKLASFPITDPEVIRLCGAGSMAIPILRQMLEDHLNKGKRANRLRKRG